MPSLRPGDILSYSAGTTSSAVSHFRVINSVDQSAKYQSIVDTLGIQKGVLPFVINAYPAALGSVPFGVMIDSYLSMSVIHRSLRLCAQQRGVAIIIAQPLFALHIMEQCRQSAIELPMSISFVLPGYYCPVSLENYLLQLTRECRSAATVLHAYGVAELDAAILVGKRLDDGVIAYQQVSSICELESTDGVLHIRRDQTLITPGDRAFHRSGYWIIEQDPQRLHASVRQELDQWDEAQWRRRTGYLLRNGSSMLFQLRSPFAATQSNEMEHFEFARRSLMAWNSKPDWS